MSDSMYLQLDCNRVDEILPYYPYSAVKAVSAAQTLGQGTVSRSLVRLCNNQTQYLRPDAYGPAEMKP